MDYEEYSTFMKICSWFGIIGAGICWFVQLVAPAFFVSHASSYPENGYNYLYSGSTALFGSGTYRELGMASNGQFHGEPSTSALVFFIISIIAFLLGILALVLVKRGTTPILLIILLTLCAVGMIVGFFANMNDTVIKEFCGANGIENTLHLTRHPLHYLVVVANLFALLGFGYPAGVIIYSLFH